MSMLLTTKKPLMQLDGVIDGLIIKRPSSIVKSPYVADVEITKGNTALAHSASLGCCGLAEKDSRVWMIPLKLKAPKASKNNEGNDNTNNNDRKCKYRICLSSVQDHDRNQECIVGIFPKYAEDLTEQALLQNSFTILNNITSYSRETVVTVDGIDEDSRFDFTGVDKEGRPFIMEVKNVPLADYEDISNIDKKKCNVIYPLTRAFNSKAAYFPDGYRKKGAESVSPRALKHIRTLTYIKKKDNNKRCILCYVIQRNDVQSFTPSVIDPEYRKAFYEAVTAGVEIITMVVEWRIVSGITSGSSTKSASSGSIAEAYFIRDDLPIVSALTPSYVDQIIAAAAGSGDNQVSVKATRKSRKKVSVSVGDVAGASVLSVELGDTTATSTVTALVGDTSAVTGPVNKRKRSTRSPAHTHIEASSSDTAAAVAGLDVAVGSSIVEVAVVAKSKRMRKATTK